MRLDKFEQQKEYEFLHYWKYFFTNSEVLTIKYWKPYSLLDTRCATRQIPVLMMELTTATEEILGCDDNDDSSLTTRYTKSPYMGILRSLRFSGLQ